MIISEHSKIKLYRKYAGRFNSRYPNYPKPQRPTIDALNYSRTRYDDNFLFFIISEERNNKWQRCIFRDFAISFLSALYFGLLLIKESPESDIFYTCLFLFCSIVFCIFSSLFLSIWNRNRWWLKRPLLYSYPLQFKILHGSKQTLYSKSP